MNAKLTKALIGLALVGIAGTAAAHDRDRERERHHHHAWERDGWHGRDPWCHEHRAFHRHFIPPGHWKDRYWDDGWHRDGWRASEFYGPYRRYGDDSLTIILRSDLR